ncbi:MAG: uridine kinase [Gemmatimonadales bacterium]|nr:MAG: uridine kinase [Gemmatimonadales bacterium]
MSREASPPVVVGVAGGSGSGKTTVVRAILEQLRPDRVGVIHHDAYYRSFAHLPEDTRAAINFDHPEALETELLVAHVQSLLNGEAVDVPVYDFRTHARTDRTLRVRPTDVLIVDGILVLAEPDLRELMDIRIFVDTDSDIRFIRRLVRDMGERGRSLESVVTQYQDTVRPMHLEFVEPSRRWADVIIPEGGKNRVAIDMVVTKLASILEARDPSR